MKKKKYNGWFGTDGLAVSLCITKKERGEKKVNAWKHGASERREYKRKK